MALIFEINHLDIVVYNHRNIRGLYVQDPSVFSALAPWVGCTYKFYEAATITCHKSEI